MAHCHHHRSSLPVHFTGVPATALDSCPCHAPHLQPIFPVRWKEKEAKVVVKKSPPPQSKKDKDQKEKTWIEIMLIDGDGDPVPEERYVVELPDGKTKEGKLDRKGRAKIEGIDPGTATVKFPDYEKKTGKDKK